MAWEISITAEGWQEIYDALHSDAFTEEQLRSALADDDYEAWEQDHDEGSEEPNFDVLKARYANLYHDTLADLAYERVEQHNTCDNGGFAYWIDRQGYHTVNLS